MRLKAKYKQTLELLENALASSFHGSKGRETRVSAASEALAARRHLFEGHSLGLRSPKKGRPVPKHFGIGLSAPPSLGCKPMKGEKRTRTLLSGSISQVSWPLSATRRPSSFQLLSDSFHSNLGSQSGPSIWENLRVEPLRSRRTLPGWLRECLRAAVSTSVHQASPFKALQLYKRPAPSC